MKQLSIFQEFLLTIITFFVFILWLLPVFVFKSFNNGGGAGVLYIPIFTLTGFWIDFIMHLFKNKNNEHK